MSPEWQPRPSLLENRAVFAVVLILLCALAMAGTALVMHLIGG